MLEHQKVNRQTTQETFAISTAIGVLPSLQILTTLPLIRDGSEWNPGEFGFMLKWNPQRNILGSQSTFFTSGFVIPKQSTPVDESINDRLLSHTNVIHRFALDRWRTMKDAYVIGVQAMVDLPFHDGYILNHRVFQFSIFQRDQRFRTKRVIPSIQVTYRNDGHINKTDKGWFLFGNLNAEIQFTDTIGGNIAWGSPIVVAIEGSNLSQSSLSFGLRWMPK